MVWSIFPVSGALPKEKAVMASRLHPDPTFINEFYTNFWSSREWADREPNRDESLRAAAITRLIETSVLPADGADRKLRILDLGCGRGWLTSLLCRFGYVVGIDPVAAATQRAKVLFPSLDIRCGESSDLISMGYEGQFDLIISSEVIEHVVDDDKRGFVDNIRRLLKPGGFAIVTTPRGELWRLWSRRLESPQPVEEWISEAELHRLCEACDLQVITKGRVFLPHCPFDWLSRAASHSRIFVSKALRDKLRYYRAIYQVILMRRAPDEAELPGN